VTDVRDLIGGILLIGGATFVALAGVGVLRLRHVIARMHAATKASTLGILLTAIGAAVRIGERPAAVKLLVAVVLIFITAPVAGHLVGRAAYNSETTVRRTGEIDELARDRDRRLGRQEERR